MEEEQLPLPPPMTPETISPSQTAPRFAPPMPPANIAPSFTQQLSDVRMVEGTNVRLECKVLGKPFPQVIFTKAQQPVLDDDR